MVKFFHDHLTETDIELLKLMALAFAAGSLIGAILGVILNHEIAEVNAARAAVEVLCP